MRESLNSMLGHVQKDQTTVWASKKEYDTFLLTSSTRQGVNCDLTALREAQAAVLQPSPFIQSSKLWAQRSHEEEEEFPSGPGEYDRRRQDQGGSCSKIVGFGRGMLEKFANGL